MLYTSQPGVSKAIIEFEDELGIKIFERHGKRIKGLTKPGLAVSQVIDRIMREVDNLKKVSDEFRPPRRGRAGDRVHPYAGALPAAARDSGLSQAVSQRCTCRWPRAARRSWSMVLYGTPSLAWPPHPGRWPRPRPRPPGSTTGSTPSWCARTTR